MTTFGLNFQATQLHLHPDIQALHSPKLGFEPSRSHLLLHVFLAVSFHKHRAMHRSNGTHFGHLNLSLFIMHVLHSLPAASFFPGNDAGEVVTIRLRINNKAMAMAVTDLTIFVIRGLEV